MHAHLEPTASPSTCTHIVLTHPVPPVCGMRSHTSPPACMPARSTFSPDNAPADCPRLDYAVASRAASHVGLCKRIRFVCSVLLWCKYNSMRDFRCLYSSVVERQSCKLKVLGSIPSGGYLLGKIATTANEHTGCSGTIAKLPVLLAIRPHGASLRDALPGRLELPTLRLTASRSSQLSYGSTCHAFPPLSHQLCHSAIALPQPSPRMPVHALSLPHGP